MNDSKWPTVVVTTDARNPDIRLFDVAEQKGTGHPDTLADRLADRFSRNLAVWSVEHHGAIVNHWVDKTMLIGAAANVWLGGFDIKLPIQAMLVGKITPKVGDSLVPLEALFKTAVEEVLPAATRSATILDHVDLRIVNTSGTAADHSKGFYRPTGTTNLAEVLGEEPVSNDTSVCIGVSSQSLAGKSASFINSVLEQYAIGDARIGSDTKSMVVRRHNALDATVAVPVHADGVFSWREYSGLVSEIAILVNGKLREWASHHGLVVETLSVNSKDREGTGYLAPFGTSLGKGDCGAVGRGNRYLGSIEPLSPASSEAPAGKNPVHHAGKVYTWVAHHVARRLGEELSCYVEVAIVSRNGGALNSPPNCLVSVEQTPHSAADLDTIAVREVQFALERIDSMRAEFVGI